MISESSVAEPPVVPYQQLFDKVLDELHKARMQLAGGMEGSCVADAGPTDLTESTRLSELGLDSLRLIEVIYDLECTYGVDADEEMLAELTTVGDIAEMMYTAIVTKPVVTFKECTDVADPSKGL